MDPRHHGPTLTPRLHTGWQEARSCGCGLTPTRPRVHRLHTPPGAPRFRASDPSMTTSPCPQLSAMSCPLASSWSCFPPLPLWCQPAQRAEAYLGLHPQGTPFLRRTWRGYGASRGKANRGRAASLWPPLSPRGEPGPPPPSCAVCIGTIGGGLCSNEINVGIHVPAVLAPFPVLGGHVRPRSWAGSGTARPPSQEEPWHLPARRCARGRPDRR